ncbi:MAG TPA: hypothetical protein VFJ58_15300 [Armatimonadota bacterium]|nr:hypothetical protein [Armatimonadota bacterium]
MSIPLSYHNPAYGKEVQSLKEESRVIVPPDPRLTRLALAAVGVGVLGFVAGLLYAPGRMWGAFDANFAFWVGLSEGAIVVAATLVTGFARWGRTITRIIEPLGLFSLFSPILYVVLWFGRGHLFSWIYLRKGDHSPWLQALPMLWRDELVLLIMAALTVWWLYRSLRPDLAMTKNRKPDDWLTSWLLRDWKGAWREWSFSQAVLRNLGPFLIVGFCWGYAMVSIDLTMTLDPKFKSTMFPGIYWVSEFLAPIALAPALVWAWRRWNSTAHDLITTSNILDMGNMAWGFAIFRTWFDWSQYIIIWYGNLPDEAHYIMARWRTHPWNMLAYIGLGLAFIGPFFAGFSRTLKKGPLSCAIFGLVIFTGILVERFVDVMPSIPHIGPQDFGFIELAITIGFAGGIALPYLWLTQRVPLFPISDPLFSEALETRGVPET